MANGAVPGYLYVLRNPAYPDLLKIGKTRRTPEDRAQELSASTGVPDAFHVVYQLEMPDCDIAERLTHEQLKDFRHKADREFFRVSEQTAISVVNEIGASLLERHIKELEDALEETVKEYRMCLVRDIEEKRTLLMKIKPEPNTAFEPRKACIYLSGNEKHWFPLDPHRKAN